MLTATKLTIIFSELYVSYLRVVYSGCIHSFIAIMDSTMSLSMHCTLSSNTCIPKDNFLTFSNPGTLSGVVASLDDTFHGPIVVTEGNGFVFAGEHREIYVRSYTNIILYALLL